MDMPAQEISVDNVLRVGFLFQILVRRASMGLRARLEAMESHSTVQKWKRPRSAFASLYSHDSDIVNAPNAHGSTLEENFYKQKDALISLAHSNIANREFSKQPAYAFDPLGFALPKPQLYDRLLSSKDKDSYPLHHAKLNYRLNSELRQGTASCDNVISVPEHSSTSPSAIAGMQDFNIRGTSVDLHPTPSELSMHVCSSNAIISSSDQHVSSQSKAALSEVQGQYEGSLMGPFHDKAGFSTAQVVEKSIMKPYYKQLLEDIQKRDTRQKELDSKIEVQRIYWENLQRTKQALFALKRKETAQKAKPPELAPLSEKEEEEVRKALNGANRKELLVQHEPSNIDLSREALQCLMPGAWLNDEVEKIIKTFSIKGMNMYCMWLN
ncbi:hypothetical protein KP509_02G064800 [Ceratopteris richardii]|uniref:Uncharacterized protein n=1 Tax=Ceratopteris richardii TaxID=49495 RepID=A0A8T2V6I5_CERRI|nr:hypothetical protein KP509_02G064800 [Ceratopteris richardii]